MTLDQARDHIGSKVIYKDRGQVEEGVITSVNDVFVFVRYGSQTTSAATRPGMLRLLAGDNR